MCLSSFELSEEFAVSHKSWNIVLSNMVCDISVRVLHTLKEQVINGMSKCIRKVNTVVPSLPHSPFMSLSEGFWN